MQIFNNNTKKLALILVGPLGCYIAYQVLFIGRYLSVEKYPLLTSAYMNGATVIDSVCALTVAALGFILSRRLGLLDDFSPSLERLSTLSLALITTGILFLLALSMYRVFGTLSPRYVVDNYHTYSFMVTNGGAWIVLAMYSALLLQLMNMYFSGVTLKNGAFLLLSLLIVSFSGGRGILILFALTFIVLLMFQRVSLVKFLIASMLAVASMGISYVIITNMRAPAAPLAPIVIAPVAPSEAMARVDELAGKKANQAGKPVAPKDAVAIDPTNSFEDLNYNAAFISEDVLSAIQGNKVEPRAYALEDAMTLFIPRQLMPSKPISTAETRALYPHVAKRGTNITFPLKANVLMHLGGWAFYADWVVVLLCQTLMILGISRRTKAPSILGFAMLFCGIGFTLIARGGIFNARLLVIVFCVLAAYVGYRALLRIETTLHANRRERLAGPASPT
ncbi:hypothetical protein [Pseudomonas sp. P97.38]|uniref:hypothetical protein n=1 Tax=Pseudomonas sp. P97.38 TaxID=255451 RepID=UPI00069E3CC5|nr:hypothetical protein [Pseudomonas sp. P97.38]